MARMLERYTGTVFEVADGDVEKRLAQGYVLEGEREPAEPEQDAEIEQDVEIWQMGEPEQEPDDEPKPTDGSTIAEIRAYAKRHGIELPKGGKKAELLALI